MLKRLKDNRRGSIMVEPALTVPLVFILCMGATDFARLFYHALTIKGASSGAALLGAQDQLSSGGNPGMTARATSDADNLSGITATPTQVCQCPNAAPFSCQDYGTTTCPGYGALERTCEYKSTKTSRRSDSTRAFQIRPTSAKRVGCAFSKRGTVGNTGARQ